MTAREPLSRRRSYALHRNLTHKDGEIINSRRSKSLGSHGDLSGSRWKGTRCSLLPFSRPHGTVSCSPPPGSVPTIPRFYRERNCSLEKSHELPMARWQSGTGRDLNPGGLPPGPALSLRLATSSRIRENLGVKRSERARVHVSVIWTAR